MIAVLERQTVVLEAILTVLKDGTMPSRELEAPIGVSHMTIYKAQQIMKEDTQP